MRLQLAVRTPTDVGLGLRRIANKMEVFSELGMYSRGNEGVGMLNPAMGIPSPPVAGVLQKNVKRSWVHSVNKRPRSGSDCACKPSGLK